MYQTGLKSIQKNPFESLLTYLQTLGRRVTPLCVCLLPINEKLYHSMQIFLPFHWPRA